MSKSKLCDIFQGIVELAMADWITTLCPYFLNFVYENKEIRFSTLYV